MNNWLVFLIICATLGLLYCVVALIIGFRGFYKRKENFIRPKRLVASTSTLPSRIGHVQESIDSIVNSEIRPDKVYLNIPRVSKKEGKEYDVSDINTHGGLVVINWLDKDYGPLCKLYGTLLMEFDPETVIVCFDDDIIYDKRLISHLLSCQGQYPEAAVCESGWNYVNLGLVALSLKLSIPGVVQKVDELQCFNGVAYRRRMFQDDFEDWKEKENCYTVDDILISKYLRHRQIPILAIPYWSKNKNIKIPNKTTLIAHNLFRNRWINCK